MDKEALLFGFSGVLSFCHARICFFRDLTEGVFGSPAVIRRRIQESVWFRLSKGGSKAVLFPLVL